MIKPEDVIAAVKTYIEDINVESGPVGGSSVGGSKGVYVYKTQEKRDVILDTYL